MLIFRKSRNHKEKQIIIKLKYSIYYKFSIFALQNLIDKSFK